MRRRGGGVSRYYQTFIVAHILSAYPARPSSDCIAPEGVGEGGGEKGAHARLPKRPLGGAVLRVCGGWGTLGGRGEKGAEVRVLRGDVSLGRSTRPRGARAHGRLARRARAHAFS